MARGPGRAAARAAAAKHARWERPRWRWPGPVLHQPRRASHIYVRCPIQCWRASHIDIQCPPCLLQCWFRRVLPSQERVGGTPRAAARHGLQHTNAEKGEDPLPFCTLCRSGGRATTERPVLTARAGARCHVTAARLRPWAARDATRCNSCTARPARTAAPTGLCGPPAAPIRRAAAPASSCI